MRPLRPPCPPRWSWPVAAGCAAALAGPAAAQLPATGTGLVYDNPRVQLAQYFPEYLNRSPTPGWLIVPSVSGGLGFTDNGALSGSGGSFDGFSRITPGVYIAGDTARLQVNLNYQPTLSIRFANSDQTRLQNSLSARLLATVVPETLFLDLRGVIANQSRLGGFVSDDNDSVNRNDQIESRSFSATPYLQHRFGGWGTGRLSYSIAQTNQVNQGRDNNFLTTPSGALIVGDTGFGQPADLTTQRQRASFTTGENLGRINDILVVEAVQYSGPGPYRGGAHRNTATNDIGYAVTRTIILLGGFGYQDLQFAGTPPFRVREPIWNAGVRLLPNADSTITVTYGRRDGFNSIAFDGVYSPTARTRIFGRYTTGLTTNAEEQQNLLQTTSAGPGGLLVDSVTGAPVVATSNFFGTQNSLYRVRRLSITGLLIRDRDSFSATVSNEERTTVTDTVNAARTGIVPAGTSATGTYGSLTWQHELTPLLSSVAAITYGVNNNGALIGNNVGSQRTLALQASLSQRFTETLSGTLTYTVADRFAQDGGGVPAAQGGNVLTNTVFLGFFKSF